MSRVKRVREWVGGRVVLPAKIESKGEQTAAISLWVELPGLQVVGHVLDDQLDPQVTFGRSLMRAMASPLVGLPRRPQRVRVADASLAAQIEGFSFLTVEVAPTPEFDRVVRSLGSFLEESSCLSDPSWTPERIEAFFAAAKALWLLHPWTRVRDDELVRVEVPALGIEDGCVSIVGASEEVRGFAFLPSYLDYERMRRGDFAAHAGLYFSFERREAVSLEMRAAIKQNRWPLAEDDAYPVLLRLVDGKSAPVLERELGVTTAFMNALIALLTRHPAAFERYDQDTVSEKYVAQDGLELILSVPHPLALSRSSTRS